MPLYIITQQIEQGGTPAKEIRLVDAKTPAGAIAHVVAATITCTKATPAQAFECAQKGLKVEVAGA